MKRAKRNIFVLIPILITTLLICVHMYNIYDTKTSKLPKWDMASYTIRGYIFAEHVKNYDIESFLDYTNKQQEKPPIYFHLLTAIFLLLGTGFDSATLLSTFAFFLLIIFIYLISIYLSEKDGWFIGILACFMALTSKHYLAFSVLIMMEMLGALLTLIALFLYLRAKKEHSIKFYLSTSVATLSIFFFKYNYGLFFIALLFLTEFISIEKERKRLNVTFNFNISSYHLYLFIPIFLTIVLWFIYPYPEKINNIKRFLINRSSGIPFLSLKNFLFYPNVIIDYYVVSSSIFAFLTILFVSSFFSKNESVKIIRNLFLIGLAMIMIHDLKGSRFIFTIVPAFWLVAAYQFNELIIIINKKLSSYRIFSNRLTINILTFILVVGTSYNKIISLKKRLPSYLQDRSFCNKNLSSVFNYIETNIDQNKNIFIFGSFNEISPNLIKLKIAEKGGFIKKIKVDELMCYGKRMPTRVISTGMSKEYKIEFSKWLKSSNSDCVVTINVEKDSLYYTDDYQSWNEWKLNYIRLMKNQKKYGISTEKYFDDLKLKVIIYKKRNSEYSRNL